MKLSPLREVDPIEAAATRRVAGCLCRSTADPQPFVADVRGPGAIAESVDGVEGSKPAARAGVYVDGSPRRHGDSGPVDDAVAVRIV